MNETQQPSQMNGIQPLKQPIREQRKPLEERWWYWVMVLFVILMCIGLLILAIF